MPVINRIDLLANESLKKNNAPTNWFVVVDKFLNNDKVQQSIFAIIEKFKKPISQPQPQQNTIQNDEEIIRKFISRLVEIGQGKKTLDEINAEFEKLKK